MHHPTFKVLSVLLQYPTAEMISHAETLLPILSADNSLASEIKEKLVTFIQHLSRSDLLDAQECYVGLFDRTRSLSLHMFEHVHGESRDRGQAMVDLKDHYHSYGFMMDVNELPDYLPLILEFLAFIPREEARDILRELLNILISIFSRLQALNSQYAFIFKALIAFTDIEVTDIPAVDPDKIFMTTEELDEDWKEQPISFMGEPCHDNARQSDEKVRGRKTQ